MFEVSNIELPWFDAYVRSGRAPHWMMEVPDIHGFLTGLAMAGPLPDAEWMPWIWSNDEPRFESKEEEWHVLGEILAFDTQIQKSLSSYRILSTAVLPSTEDGLFFVAAWAEGFYQAIVANPYPWQEVEDIVEDSLRVVLAARYINHDGENDGFISREGVDEINFHLRHLNRILQNQSEYHWSKAKAA